MLAAIDVGSNTVRMLLGEVAQGKVQPQRYERIITRLKGGQTDKGLAPDAMERTFVALQQFKKLAGLYSPESISVVGTEALRSAANGNDLVKRVKRDIGLDIRIIDGDEEGGLSSSGVMSALNPIPDYTIIVDIGGGSTEVVLVSQGSVLARHSSSLGVVRLSELSSDTEREQLVDENLDTIQSIFSAKSLQSIISNPETCFVGTAGTVTTLAAIDLMMADYDWRRINNYRLSRDRISSLLDDMKPLSVADRERISGMEAGRGDLIVSGINVLLVLMELFTKNELIVSDFGLLEGLLLQMATGSAID